MIYWRERDENLGTELSLLMRQLLISDYNSRIPPCFSRVKRLTPPICTVSAPMKPKVKVDNELLAGLEASLADKSFLAGEQPGKEDAQKYAQVSSLSFVGYPKAMGWFHTVSAFEEAVRAAW